MMKQIRRTAFLVALNVRRAMHPATQADERTRRNAWRLIYRMRKVNTYCLDRGM